MFDPIHISQHDAGYPPALRQYLGDQAPGVVTARGNLSILGNTGTGQHSPLIALFCSVQCPGEMILRIYELALALRQAGVTVISGFHSPMEKECLLLFLRGEQPVIICPARSVDRMRLPADWRVALHQHRLLLLSRFTEKQRHATNTHAQQRNKLVAALADVVLVAYATPGGKTEGFCSDVLAWGKPLLILEHEESAGLLALGAKVIRPEQIGAHAWWLQ